MTEADPLLDRAAIPDAFRRLGDRLVHQGVVADISEYRAALEAARDARQWRYLAQMLNRWRLRALAYSSLGFDAAAQAARDAQPEDLTPVPGLAGWR